MAWKKVGGLALSLCVTACGTMHPFSKMPGSSGKLDKTPRVLILRGQAPEVCRTDEKPFQLFYFIHLNFMGPQSLWVEDVKRGELELFGEHFTLKVTTKATAGALTYVETKFRTAQQSYSITTRVMDCKGGVSGEVREMWDRASDRHVALL